MTSTYDGYRKGLEDLDLHDHIEKQKRTLCHFVGGVYHGQHMTEYQVELLYCNGKHNSDDKEIRANGGCTHYAVLDNVPEVEGYTMMWDGGMIRYETWDIYKMMLD